MARLPRFCFPGAMYHVLNRGNNQQVVFAERDDYKRYLDVLLHYKKKLCFKIFAFCLMTNHVHLLIQVGEKATISKIMQAMTVAHTRKHHFKYQTSGHVWQGRFKSPLVSDDEYLLNTMRYIEQNPVRAKMVRQIDDYPWSSFKLNTQNAGDKFIDRMDNPVFVGLGKLDKDRIAAYRDFAQTLLEREKVEEVRRSLAADEHYVSEGFQRQITELMARRQKAGRRGRPSCAVSDIDK